MSPNLFAVLTCLCFAFIVYGQADLPNSQPSLKVASVQSQATTSDGEHVLIRSKRQYYDNDYYGSYYGWQAGRIVGWILGFIVLMLVICVPCICCIGIWFAGWFGLRQAMARRRGGRLPGGQNTLGGVLRDGDHVSSPIEHRVVYAAQADRYYEGGRRPRTPPNSNNSGNSVYGGRERESRRV